MGEGQCSFQRTTSPPTEKTPYATSCVVRYVACGNLKHVKNKHALKNEGRTTRRRVRTQKGRCWVHKQARISDRSRRTERVVECKACTACVQSVVSVACGCVGECSPQISVLLSDPDVGSGSPGRAASTVMCSPEDAVARITMSQSTDLPNLLARSRWPS